MDDERENRVAIKGGSKTGRIKGKRPRFSSSPSHQGTRNAEHYLNKRMRKSNAKQRGQRDEVACRKEQEPVTVFWQEKAGCGNTA